MKRAVALLVLLAASGLLGWRVYRKASESLQAPERRGRGGAVAVEVSPVRQQTIRDVERFTGTLRASSQFIVAPKIGARLEKLHVDVADRVERNQLIAELDDEEYRRQVDQARAEWEVTKASAEEIRLVAALDDEELAQQVAQAQAELGSAKANVAETRSALDVAQRELDRAKALHAKDILSLSELDTVDARYKAAKAKQEVALAQVTQKEAALRTAQVRVSETQRNARVAEYEVARAQVAQKEAALRAAEVRLSYTQIKATWDEKETGDAVRKRVVGERFVDAGTMLKANDPIVSVLDIHLLEGLVHVTERDYGKVQAGQKVTVTTDAAAGRTFEGTIVRVAPQLKEASRQAEVEIEVPNPELLLKPGMFIRAQIEFGRHEGATVVPRSSVVRRDRKRGVFLADKEKLTARFVPVTEGIVEGDLAEVADPPKGFQSAWVVVLGHHLLEDGSAITLPGEAAQAPAARQGAPKSPGGLQPPGGYGKGKANR